MPHEAEILGLKGYEIKNIEWRGSIVDLDVSWTGEIHCPHCGSGDLRNKDRYIRHLRHET